LDELRFADGPELLAAIGQLAVDDVALGPSSTRIAALTIDSVELPVRREADGGLRLAGLRIGRGAAQATAAPAITAARDAAPAGPAPRFELALLSLRNAALPFL